MPLLDVEGQSPHPPHEQVQRPPVSGYTARDIPILFEHFDLMLMVNLGASTSWCQVRPVAVCVAGSLRGLL